MRCVKSRTRASFSDALTHFQMRESLWRKRGGEATVRETWARDCSGAQCCAGRTPLGMHAGRSGQRATARGRPDGECPASGSAVQRQNPPRSPPEGDPGWVYVLGAAGASGEGEDSHLEDIRDREKPGLRRGRAPGQAQHHFGSADRPQQLAEGFAILQVQQGQRLGALCDSAGLENHASAAVTLGWDPRQATGEGGAGRPLTTQVKSAARASASPSIARLPEPSQPLW